MESENVKVVLLGESGVGKTAIAIRYVKNEFDQKMKPTIGASFLPKSTKVENVQFELSIWDTAGQEVYRTLTPLYYRDANMAIIVFDLTVKSSFDAVQSWINQVKEHNPDALLILAGNKCDLEAERVITMNEALGFAQSKNISYQECSAFTGYGVDILFDTLLTNYIKSTHPEKQTEPIDKVVKIDSNQSKSTNKGKCC